MWVTEAEMHSGRNPVCRRSLGCCFAPDNDVRGLLFLDLKNRFLFWRNWQYLNVVVECTCLENNVNMFVQQSMYLIGYVNGAYASVLSSYCDRKYVKIVGM